jgi:shikimate 5-dehydrogenase
MPLLWGQVQYGAFPLLPYEHFTANHIAFDLIYNPETQFLKRKKKRTQIKMAWICLFSGRKSVEDLD